MVLFGCQLPTATPRLLRVASVSATDSDGENVIGNVIDGVPGTRWATGEKGAEVTLDLGAKATVTALQIRWVGKKGRTYAFRLATSLAGETWQDLGGERHSMAEHGKLMSYELPPTQARLLRLHSLGNTQNQWMHIAEIRIMGTGGTPAVDREPKRVRESALHRVGDKKSCSGFGYYGICPESPDGTRICYTRFVDPPTAYRVRFRAELWVCDRDLKNQRKVADIPAVGPHNTAMALWVDNRRIVYQSGYHETFVVDADTGQTVLGPLAGQLQHNAHDGRFLICLNKREAPPEKRGLYSVDAHTGEQRLILPTRTLLPFADRIQIPDPDRWVIQHGQWSEDGSLIAMKLWAANGIPCMLFTCKADGSDIVCFGPKPMHFQWYDEQTLFGHDDKVADGLPDNKELRRWRRDATVVETLGGYGCHPAMSPDRQWIATETWYGSEPVRLMLYERAELAPDRLLDIMAEAETVWAIHAHVNPAFSRDGKRVYFTRAVAAGLSQAYYVDLP